MEVEKAKMMSLDMTQENILKIRSIFPNAVTEVIGEDGNIKLAIDFDVLKQELSDTLISEKQERYQMTWPDKKQSILLSNKSVTATLRPLFEKSCDFNTTENIYIEGDNLDVLKLLRETYLGKIKMIYIDPPYNTGNDFVYNDDFSIDSESYLDNSGQYDEEGNRLVKNSESNGRFHTDWLNMMYPRLKVAKDLLADDGIIFISIDDNEIANLLKIGDEIFGKNAGQLVRKVMEGGKSDSTGFAHEHEYCLVYCKHDISGFYKKELSHQDHYNKKDEYFNERGYYYLKPLENGGLGYVPSLDYAIKGPDGVDIYPGDFHGDNGFRWVWGKEKFERALSLGMIEFTPSQKDRSKYKVYYKIYEMVDSDGNPSSMSIPFGSLYMDGFTNRQAVNDVKRLFDARVFDYPKPVSFLKEIIKMSTAKDDYVLDFFSGSGSLAEAVLELNQEEGRNNKFILVQLPEKCDEKTEAYKSGYKTICDIGEERIRRVAKKLKEDNGLLGDSVDVGFRVFKLDSSNMNEVFYNPKAITQNLLEATVDNIKPDRTPLDLLFQVMLECGALLSSKIEEKEINGKKVYVVEDNYIAACFDDEVDDKTVEAIAKLKPIYACFKGSSFNNDSANINAEQIFKTYSPNTEKIKVI